MLEPATHEVEDRTRALRTPALPIAPARDNGETMMLPEPLEIIAAAGKGSSISGYQPQPVDSKLHGRRFLGYELHEMIGQGGMGAVYQATHLWLGRTVAIKFLATQFLRDPEALARFAHEARAVGSLDHPNIVRATDAGQSQGIPYLVTEFVAGQDLAGLVKKHGPLNVADACEIIRQAALGLQHAHDQGLVHRDVKPSNLLMDASGTVKLLDFGLARIAAGQTSLTATGQMMGTLDYLAPEQACDAGRVDGRADIYSLGCTFYFLLTGTPPFAGPSYATPASKLKGHLSDAPTLPRNVRNVPAAAMAKLERMMAKSPNERFQNPYDVAAALEKMARGAELASLANLAVGAKLPSRRVGQPGVLSSFISATFAVLNPLRWFRQSCSVAATLQPARRKEPIVSLGGIVGMLFLGFVLSRFIHFGGPPGSGPQQPGLTIERVSTDENGNPMPDPVMIQNPNVKRSASR